MFSQQGYFRTVGCWLVVPHAAVLLYAVMWASSQEWELGMGVLMVVVVGGLLLHLPSFLLFKHWHKIGDEFRDRSDSDQSQ